MHKKFYHSKLNYSKQLLKSLLFIAILCWSTFSFAQPKLQQLQTQIQSIKSSLNHDQNKYSELIQQLQQNETNMGDVSSQLQKTHQKLSQQQKTLLTLKQQQTEYATKLQAQQDALAQQLRTIYLLSQQPYLKLLLNQQDSNQLDRMLNYYHYITQQRVALINQFSQTIMMLQQNALEIKTHTTQLASIQTEQQKQAALLKSATLQRKQVLNSLNQQMQNQQQQLQILLNNKHALEQVVSRLQRHPSRSQVATHFTPLHGKMPWPTNGKIIAHFGTNIMQSQLQLTGVLIQAPTGQSVHAVMAGDIVYANWMAGYGLLLIVDSGNGYMTIYGRNQSIYKKVGDHVKAGEIIATVGNSGGFNTPALYFAIRENGKAINPESWCA